jgi:glycosyltransferase involved in cell wall biosynthesis
VYIHPVAVKPVLTIITPVFNGEKFITETISSVLNATITIPYEYIVLDDGSTDSTASMLKKFADRIKILTHTNIGESDTVNRGIKNAVGDFILILNADDPLFSSDLINSGCKVLESQSRVVAVYPDWKIIDEFGATLKINILPNYSDEIMIGKCRCLPGPGTLFRKDAALQIGGRHTKWKFVGDYDFYLRLSRIGKILRIPGVFAQWRENTNSISISQRSLNMAMERIDVIETFLSKNKVSNKIRQQSLGNSYYLAARLAFFDPKIQGRQLMIKSFSSTKFWPSEAKIHVVLYLLLLPVSKKLLDRFPSVIKLITKLRYW